MKRGSYIARGRFHSSRFIVTSIVGHYFIPTNETVKYEAEAITRHFSEFMVYRCIVDDEAADLSEFGSPAS